TARPYAYLDDAPLEERRTQAVQNRRWSDPESADDLGALDLEAIEAVRGEAWPEARNADEMHEALNRLGFLTSGEAEANPGWGEWLAQLSEQRRAGRLDCAGSTLWLAAERLPAMRLVHPAAKVPDAFQAPRGYPPPDSAEAATVELTRARLGGFGPRTAGQLAADLGIGLADQQYALAALEREGYVLRGRFSPGATEEEWCERHLLARIHRYTVKRLRREIEPVERADFMRFLFDWQRLAPGTRGRGAESLATVVEQLEGFQAAAAAWESELLAARVADYASHWLDQLCRSGRIVWARLAGRSKAAGGPLRSAPIVLLPRRELGLWSVLQRDAPEPELSPRAARVLEVLREQGASFFDELSQDAHLLRSELENALGELVSVGRVNADSFAGLRTLLMPADKRSRQERRSRGLPGGMQDAGRWAPLRRAKAEEAGQRLPAEVLEHVARTLLRRYGVVAWRLLEREADWLPPWRELLRVYHRLEARGEIRGGRFIAGLAGEQFALAEAVGLLREVRKRPPDGAMLVVSAVDPLNLVGGLLPGERVPAVTGNRLLYRDGAPLAALVAGKVRMLAEVDGETAQQIRALLIRRH
ncbi:TPA: ATP-dependent DNA helicase, partial [Pseudomonas aeruginosa]